MSYPLYIVCRTVTPLYGGPDIDRLKQAFTTAPVLAHYDSERENFIETDASDWVSSAIVFQKDNLGNLRPVAFMSKKHSPAEYNYKIYDKELLIIIKAFESWRSELQGAPIPITVLSNYCNLENFMSTKMLTRHQVRWSEFLSETLLSAFDLALKGGNLMLLLADPRIAHKTLQIRDFSTSIKPS